MLKEVRFTINEKPIPLKRHRHRFNKAYDPQRKEKFLYKTIIKHSMKNYPIFQEELLQGPLALTLEFYFPIPKNKKNTILYHPKRPDLDNLIKFILDVMTDILYKDDAYIYKINAIKCYDKNPRTNVIIKEVNQLPFKEE